MGEREMLEGEEDGRWEMVRMVGWEGGRSGDERAEMSGKDAE